jgi:hypothetical protein
MPLYYAENEGHRVAVPRSEREVRSRLLDRKPAPAQRGSCPPAARARPVEPVVPGGSFPDEMRYPPVFLEGHESR